MVDMARGDDLHGKNLDRRAHALHSSDKLWLNVGPPARDSNISSAVDDHPLQKTLSKLTTQTNKEVRLIGLENVACINGSQLSRNGRNGAIRYCEPPTSSSKLRNILQRDN